MKTNYQSCNCILLPTEKANHKNSIMSVDGYLIPMENDTSDDIINWDGKSLNHLYFLSDEEIKEGDWYINLSNNFIGQEVSVNILASIKLNPQRFKKIIATTDESLGLPRPSNEFLKKYCELGGIDEVLVEYEEDTYSIGIKDYKEEGYWKLKVAPDNTITTKFIKDSWSREEVENLLKRAFGRAKSTGCYLDGDQVSSWIKENL